MIIRFLTGMLTLCVMFGAAFVGVYPTAAAASNQPSNKPLVSGSKKTAQAETDAHNKDYVSQAEQYYESGSLPQFQIAFSRLDEKTKDKWLDKALEDGKWNFQSMLFNALDLNSAGTANIRKYSTKG